MAQDKPSPPVTTQRPCPICGKPAVAMMAPFCSKRCSDIDLHKWLGGVYAVPVDDNEASDLEDDGMGT